MQSAYLEMLNASMLRIALTAAAVVVVTFTAVGPIGTYTTLAPLDRLVYAVVSAFFCLPIFYSLSVLTAYFTRYRSPLQVGLAAALVLLVMALPCAAVVYTFQALFYSQHSPQIGFLTIYLMLATATLTCHFVFHYVLCQRVKLAAKSAPDSAATGATAARESEGSGAAAHPPGQSTVAAPAGGSPPPEAAQPPETPSAGDAGSPPRAAHTTLVDRLLPDPGGEIIFLKAEGRYVEVHTTTGTNRMIARFADIVAQLEGLGIQVHRSYWVSLSHTAELLKRDTHTLVRLTDGREIPVSRTYLAVVRTALRHLAG